MEMDALLLAKLRKGSHVQEVQAPAKINAQTFVEMDQSYCEVLVRTVTMETRSMVMVAPRNVLLNRHGPVLVGQTWAKTIAQKNAVMELNQEVINAKMITNLVEMVAVLLAKLSLDGRVPLIQELILTNATTFAEMDW